jgi:hypothetical protein
MGILPSSSLRTIPAPEAVQCLRRRPEARRLAQADAEALIREHVIDAYVEARRRERDGSERDGPEPERWRLAALAVAKMTGKRVGLDTATRIAMDADFSSRVENERPERAPMRKPPDGDQLAELKRILGDQ